MSKATGQETLTPMARGEQEMARQAQKGRGARVEAGSETMIGTSRGRARGAEHRADLNIGSMGALGRRGRRGAVR